MKDLINAATEFIRQALNVLILGENPRNDDKDRS